MPILHPDCVQRLYCGLSPEMKEGGIFMAVEAYQMFSDDSYSEDVYVVGGFLGTIEMWTDFSPQWFAALKESPRLGYYTTNDALGLKGPFANRSESARDARMGKLASVIPSENCWGVTCYLLRKDFDEFFTPNFPAVWNDPYYLCADYMVGQLCLEMLLKGMRPTMLDFIFDRQGKVGRNFKIQYDVFLKPTTGLLFPFWDSVAMRISRVIYLFRLRT